MSAGVVIVIGFTAGMAFMIIVSLYKWVIKYIGRNINE